MSEETEEVAAEAEASEDYDERFLVAALMVFVARGDGAISQDETGKMLALVGEHFGLPSGTALALLTRAMQALAEDPDLLDRLRDLAPALAPAEKEDVAFMLLNVAAADGRKDAAEMELLRRAGDVLGITPEGMHRAFDRYFSETWS